MKKEIFKKREWMVRVSMRLPKATRDRALKVAEERQIGESAVYRSIVEEFFLREGLQNVFGEAPESQR